MNRISTDTLAIEQPKRRKLFYGYVVVFVSFLICMVGFGATYCFGIFFKPLLIEFGWTRSSISGAFSVNMVMQLVIGFFAGKLTDKIGPTKVITAVGIIGGLGFILMSKTHCIWQVYIYYGVFGGTLGAGTFVPALSTVGRWFAKGRGLMNGLVVAGIGMGIMVAPPLVQQMVDILNWRTALIVIGITVLISILVGAIFGFSTSIAGLGSALGPYIGGRIFDYTGSYYSAFMMCAGLCVLGLMLTLTLKRADY